MNDEQADRSLAAQAAAWVPPWARQAPSPDEPDQPVETPEAETAETPETPETAETAPGTVEPAEPDPADATEPAEAVEPAQAVEPAEPVDETGGAAASEAEPVAVQAEQAEPFAEEAEPFAEATAPVDDDLSEPELPAVTVAAPDIERPAALLDAAELRGALEAILLVVDEPVSDALLADVTEQPVERITATLAELAGEYTESGRGFALRRAAGGWRLYTREEFAPYVERFVLDGQQARLTQASLETLAVVAYKQPVTRSQVSAIRGVNCDGVMRTLVTRGLIEEAGTEPETGARLFRTTTLFLEKLGLDSVDELPPLAPFLPDDVNEIADAQH